MSRLGYGRLGTGATAVGVKIKDGVVLGAEKRVSYGGYVMSRVGKKVFKITDRLAIAAAGLFADMQTLTRILAAEVRYYELSLSSKISVYAAAKLLATIMYSYKHLPFLSELLFGGIDETGPHLYVIDPVGSVLEDNYAAIGTGAPIAIGIIESGYNKEMNIEKATDLVIKAIKAAISRDATSGDGIDIVLIKPSGAEERSYRL